MTPRPRELVLDLLSTLNRGSLPVRALVEAAALFGIEENALRVALARLLAQRRVRRCGRGRYALGPEARAMGAQVAAWRRLEGRLRPWSGGWAAVLGRGDPTGGPASLRRERALQLLGFRALERSVHVRPDNLVGGVTEIRQRLAALCPTGSGTVGRLDELDRPTEARARGLWDSAAIRRGYRTSLDLLRRSTDRLPGLSRDEAMVETFRVGGRVIRQLVRDPLLPEPLVPAGERNALVRVLREYDRLGRTCWSGFMRAHGAPHRAAPADLGAAVSLQSWALVSEGAIS